MELKGEDYLVTFNEPKAAVEFFGTIRLRDSSDYKAISDLLDAACRQVPGELLMDFRNLQFLNSAGINTTTSISATTTGFLSRSRLPTCSRHAGTGWCVALILSLAVTG